ncbi:MAG: hypothetical protein J6B50_07820 [Lachnospiraceae bacterium]|nr:hypothetical protein [Lachnospiraceae bacterium]MBP3507480.1 hypothetical protein [Lachnospiraceae bacterium]
MSTIIYDARLIKTYEAFLGLCEYTNKEESFIEILWQGLIEDSELMKEFMYYLDNHALLDQIRFEGYGLTDLYFWKMREYNYYSDWGKNTEECNKESLVLETFYAMVDMKKNPEEYRKRLGTDEGMDRFR